MWEPFNQSITEWLPNCCIIYDKFHIMKHANEAIDEIRRAEFFRKGGPARELVKGKRWLLLTRWVHLTVRKKQQLNELYALNRRIMKAYLLKESLDRLWSYHYEGSMMRNLKSWIDQLHWQRLKAGRSAASPPGGHPELLPDQGSNGSGRGSPRQHQSAVAPRTRQPQPQLPAPESATTGRYKNPTRRVSESRVKR
jgi:hypothetical protein